MIHCLGQRTKSSVPLNGSSQSSSIHHMWLHYSWRIVPRLNSMQTSHWLAYGHWIDACVRSLCLRVHVCGYFFQACVIKYKTNDNCNQFRNVKGKIMIAWMNWMGSPLHNVKSSTYFSVALSLLWCVVFGVCVCLSNFLLGRLSRMTTLITITIEGKGWIEKDEKWVEEKNRFSEHNLLHITITIGKSRSMMGVILTQGN